MGGPFARPRRGRYSIPYRRRLRQSVVTLMPRRAAASSSVDDSASTCTMWRRSTSSRERPASGVAGAAGGGSSSRSGRSSARMVSPRESTTARSSAFTSSRTLPVHAEAATAHVGLEVAVGGGDDARVDFDRLAPADALEAVLLEEAEQLALQLGREVAHLVQEDGAAARGLEPPRLVLPRAGEGALHVSEELALEQVLGQAGARDGDERARVARAPGVHGGREHVLPGAALAGKEQGGIRGRRLAGGRERARHGRARRLEQRRLVEDAAERPVLAPERLHLEDAREEE